MSIIFHIAKQIATNGLQHSRSAVRHFGLLLLRLSKNPQPGKTRVLKSLRISYLLQAYDYAKLFHLNGDILEKVVHCCVMEKNLMFFHIKSLLY